MGWDVDCACPAGMVVMRGASAVGTLALDTTPTGSLPTSGYDFTGAPVAYNSMHVVFCYSLYAFATTSGIDITPTTDSTAIFLDGKPDYEVGTVRRMSVFAMRGASDGFNVKCTNASDAPSALTDGYHIGVFRLETPAVTTVNGGTFGSGV